ncbi:M24 family metallopeptidase [Bacteroidota bacterium]
MNRRNLLKKSIVGGLALAGLPNYTFSQTTVPGKRTPEKLLEGFEPDFEFQPVSPPPPEEYQERIRRIRAYSSYYQCDAIVVHTAMLGRYQQSNSYLRYICDWEKEGVLIIPTYADKEPTLWSFFSYLVLWPPPGEPQGVDDIRSVGLQGRWYDRPDTKIGVLAEAIKERIQELGYHKGVIGLIGDIHSPGLWDSLGESLPKAKFLDVDWIMKEMLYTKSPKEQEIMRAGSQLVDIGIQAAQYVCKPGVTDHEIYAAFTYAQMSRGGESGDGYQIGINRYGTHISKPWGHVVEPGDIINFYVSGVTYRGYHAQSARMILVGDIGKEQEKAIAVGVEAVKRGMEVAGPGVLIRDLNAAAYGPYIENGLLTTTEHSEMPKFVDPNPDGTPLQIPVQHVPDPQYEKIGRSLRHVYPPHKGPKCMGHQTGMHQSGTFWVTSSDNTRLKPDMIFSFHAQWFDPQKAGFNLGNLLLVTEDGIENLTCHTPVEPYRIKV